MASRCTVKKLSFLGRPLASLRHEPPPSSLRQTAGPYHALAAPSLIARRLLAGACEERALREDVAFWLELLDVEYVREQGGWILRLFIDQPGGWLGAKFGRRRAIQLALVTFALLLICGHFIHTVWQARILLAASVAALAVLIAVPPAYAQERRTYGQAELDQQICHIRQCALQHGTHGSDDLVNLDAGDPQRGVSQATRGRGAGYPSTFIYRLPAVD